MWHIPGVGLHPLWKSYTGLSHTALSALNELFVQVWEEEAVPDEWRQGIIIPLYTGKGSTAMRLKQEAQLMLTTGSTRLAVSRGQQTWYHSTCYI